MRVRALHWVNYNGVWHKAGDEFTVKEEDYAGLVQYVELCVEKENPVSDAVEETEEVKHEPAKRGRKRKVETENE